MVIAANHHDANSISGIYDLNSNKRIQMSVLGAVILVDGIVILFGD